MAFRTITYLIPSCDRCGLAWSFRDPACPGGIPPHFADRMFALGELPARYGWQIQPRRVRRPLMACRTCAAAGVIPAGAGRAWLLTVTGWIRRFAPSGPAHQPTPAPPAAGHPEPVTGGLPAGQEALPAAPGGDLFPDT